MMRQLRHLRHPALSLATIPLAGLLLSAGGCASRGAPDAATRASLTTAPSAADPAYASSAAFASSPSPGLGATTGAAGTVHHSERERRLAEISTSRIGFIRVPLAKARYFISDTYENLFGTPPSTYQKMMESQAADARRQGINGLAGRAFAELPPYTTRYAQIADSDNDFLVRATAIRSLNRSRDRAATPLYVKALDDTHVPVRLEACKALGHMPDEAAVAPLLRILNRPDEDKDVRIAAADALRHYKNLEVARTLVAMLSERDFGIAWTAHHSLKILTGRDLRYDEAAWLAYLSGPEKPFG